MDDNKAKALAAALSQIEKQFGKGSIMRLGESEAAANKDIKVVSTGSLGLDLALGIGGLPRGRVVEIYGPESSGKTTLALSVIAQMQKMGGTAAFIDAENALDPDRKSARLNSSHVEISYAVFCLKKKNSQTRIICMSYYRDRRYSISLH